MGRFLTKDIFWQGGFLPLCEAAKTPLRHEARAETAALMRLAGLRRACIDRPYCDLLPSVKPLLIALILAAGALRAAETNLNPKAFGRARTLCDALLANPADTNALEAFRAGAAGIAGTNAIRTRLAAVYALGLLSNGEARAARSVIDAVLRGEIAPDIAALLNQETMSIECPVCSGGKSVECPSCRGNPVCTRCEGKGWIQAPTEGVNTRPGCPSCRGTGKCSVCRGKGRVMCAACLGRGRLHSPEKTQECYMSALSDTRRYAFENEHPEMLALRAEMDKARRCSQIAEAISIMKTALDRYPAAGNADEAREMLAGFEKDREDAERALEIKKSLVANAQRPPADHEQAARQVPAAVGSFLKALARGETGAEYWSDPKKASKLFTPGSWYIGRSVIAGSFAQVPVKVEADGVGPDAVRDVVFYLENRNGWKITVVETR